MVRTTKFYFHSLLFLESYLFNPLAMVSNVAFARFYKTLVINGIIEKSSTF